MPYRYLLKPIAWVAWKDITINLRYKSWFAASFIWPILFPLSFMFIGRGLAGPANEGLAGFTANAGTADYASFLILGNLVWMFVNINLWMGGSALRNDRVRGVFETLWVMPVNKLAIVLGATLASLVLNFIPMLAAVIFFALCGFLPVQGDPLSILAAMLMVLPFLFGFLFIFSALTLRIRENGMIVQITRAVLGILCGMQFPLAVLPESLQAVGRVVPLTHFVDIIRGVIIESRPLTFYSDSIRYLLVSGCIMFLLGLAAFESTKMSVKRKGLMSGY